jgi:4-hydroxy-tetrahydrodipicolinate synthase
MALRPEGIIAALVTPFTQDDELDEAALRSLVRHLIESRIHCLAPGVATSEYVSLSTKERERVISIVRDEAKGTIPVMSGVVSPGIKDAIETIRQAKNIGVDGVMLVSPYYNVQATQEGIYSYYKAVAEKSDIPIMIYNIPYKTGVNITPETVLKISSINNIIGIKECCRDISQFGRLVRLVGDKISLCAGEDDMFLPEMMIGAKGTVCASANLIPETWVSMFESLGKGDLQNAIKLHKKVLPLLSVLYSEPNPGPLKDALAMIGRPCGHVRPPLLPPTKSTREALRAQLSAFGFNLKVAS